MMDELNTSDLSEADISSPFTSPSSSVLSRNTSISSRYECLSIPTSDLCKPDSDSECPTDAEESTVSPESSKPDDEFGCYPITYSSDENESEGKQYFNHST